MTKYYVHQVYGGSFLFLSYWRSKRALRYTRPERIVQLNNTAYSVNTPPQEKEEIYQRLFQK